MTPDDFDRAFEQYLKNRFASTTSEAQTPPYQRGDRVRMPDSDNPRTIIAVAGDRLRVDATGLYVNEVAVSGFSQDHLERLQKTEWLPRFLRRLDLEQTIPEGHYFLAGETEPRPSGYWMLIPVTYAMSKVEP